MPAGPCTVLGWATGPYLVRNADLQQSVGPHRVYGPAGGLWLVPASEARDGHHQQTHSLEMTVAELHVKRSFTPDATLAPSLVSCRSSASVAATTCSALRLHHAPDRGDTREWPQLRTYGLTMHGDAVRQHLVPPARPESAPNCADIALVLNEQLASALPLARSVCLEH